MTYVKQITGTHFPSFKSRLAVNGTHNGQPLYQAGMKQKWVWFDTVTGGYVISDVVGTIGDYAWSQDTPTTNPDGAYHVTGSHCEGAPVVEPLFSKAGELLPARATMWHDENTLVSGTTMTPNYIPGQLYALLSYSPSPANGDSFSQSFILSKGLYSFHVLGYSDVYRGMIDWYLDNFKIVSGQDWYAAGATYNVIKSAASVQVKTDGYHKLVGTVNGKNPLALAYSIALTKYWFKPTTD